MKKRVPTYTLKQEKEILEQIGAMYTFGQQGAMLFERMAELMISINRFHRGEVLVTDVAEKIARTRIFLKQIEHTLRIESQITRYRNHQLIKLEDQLIVQKLKGEDNVQ